MRHTIPKRERLFRRMQQFSQDGMIAGQKFLPICQGDVNHGAPHSQRYLPGPRPEPVILPWSLSLNQVHPLFALHLFPRQVRQLV
jgi:hypothetical protein